MHYLEQTQVHKKHSIDRGRTLSAGMRKNGTG
jgi:hypothetical protein